MRNEMSHVMVAEWTDECAAPGLATQPPVQETDDGPRRMFDVSHLDANRGIGLEVVIAR